jgi:uncharacterized ferritin-like protein (DUF455 family)
LAAAGVDPNASADRKVHTMIYGVGTVSGNSVETTARALCEFIDAAHDTALLMASLVCRVPAVELKILLGTHIYEDLCLVRSLGERIESLTGGQWQSLRRADPWLREHLAVAATQRDPYRAVTDIYEDVKSRLLIAARVLQSRSNPFWDRETHTLLRSLLDVTERQIASASLPLAAARNWNIDLLSSNPVEARRVYTATADNNAMSLELYMPALPARDTRFCIVEEAPFEKIGSSLATATTLHSTLMCIEIVTLEVCTRMMVEFNASMPWEFLLDMSRQAWDESFHAMLCSDRIQQLGYELGAFPIDMQMWNVTMGLPLGDRLGAHQRLGEWLGTDGAMLNASHAYAANDETTGRIWEFISVDEVRHVSYGNKWIRYLGRDPAGIAEIQRRGAAARARSGKSVSGPPSLPFHRDLCLRSGFLEHEVDELMRGRGART